MPLRAILDGVDIHAFECTEEAWSILQKKYKTTSLMMPCCNCLAIPKTSKLGTYFFAHKSKSECSNAPESAEHLYLKALVAKSASEAGWHTRTEHIGFSSDGEKWIADIFCVKGNASVALEIQMSCIPYKEIFERTNRYTRSKVRSAWLVDAKKFKDWESKSNKERPIFGINQLNTGDVPLVQNFARPINEFINALLGKRIKWLSEPWVYTILYIEDYCWKCKKSVKQIYGHTIDVYSESAQTGPNASTILSKFSNFINNEELRSHGLNTIGEHIRFKGNAAGFPYCNECFHCGAPQSNYHLVHHLRDIDRVFGEIQFTSPRESSGKWSWCE